MRQDSRHEIPARRVTSEVDVCRTAVRGEVDVSEAFDGLRELRWVAGVGS